MGKGARKRADTRAREEARAAAVREIESRPALDIGAAGAPSSPWRAAWMWAGLLIALEDVGRAQGDVPRPGVRLPEPGPSWLRAVLARAITVVARDQRLTADVDVPAPLTSALALGSVSLVELAEQALAPLRALVNYPRWNRGHHPDPEEPGYREHQQLQELIFADGVSSADALADPAVMADVDDAAKQFMALADDAMRLARKAVFAATFEATAMPADVTLRDLLPYIGLTNDTDTEPDFDALFVQAMSLLGWTGGHAPDGLADHPGPWYVVSIGPSANDPSATAWCDWLCDRGWARPRLGSGNPPIVWLPIPRPWAHHVADLTMDLATQPITCMVRRWPAWSEQEYGQAQDHPHPDLLKQHYP